MFARCIIEVEAKLNIVIVWILAKTYPSNLIVISLLLENPKIRHPITNVSRSISSQEYSGNTASSWVILITLVSGSGPF
jgi:hypothetical protein